MLFVLQVINILNMFSVISNNSDWSPAKQEEYIRKLKKKIPLKIYIQ